MRVLFLNDFASVNGGADAAAIASAVALSDVGQKVAFFGGAGQADERVHSLRHMAPGLPSVHEGGSRLDVLQRGLWHREAARQASLFLDSYIVPNETVIHLHSFTKVLSPSVLGLLIKRNLPTVVTLHDYFSFCPNGNYFNFTTQTPCSLRPLSVQCCLTQCDSAGPAFKAVRIARAAVMKFTSTYGAPFDAILAVSQLSSDVVRSFLPKAPVHIVRYLLPSPQPAPPHEGGRIVYVGRLTRSKGVVTLARASRNAQVAITFVGDGEARHEVLAENPEAVVTGWVESEEVKKHILGSKAVVLPSLWYETFGLTVAEALALGRPVIVSERAGASELVHDDVNGLIWRTASEEHLVSCLRRLNDEAVARAMSEAAARIYRSRWVPPQVHAEQLLEIYQGILGGRKDLSEQRNHEAAAGH